jgi:hypothetical protein
VLFVHAYQQMQARFFFPNRYCQTRPNISAFLRPHPEGQQTGSTMNGLIYGGVAKFLYLGSLFCNDKRVEKEIQRRILVGKRTYFAAISFFKS